MANKCLNCSNRLEQTEGKRVKLYCSDACRKAYNRSLPDNIDDSLPDKPLPDTTLKALPDKQPEQWSKEHWFKDGKIPQDTEGDNSVTTPKAVQGICHGCGKEVKDYICICYSCTSSGITHESLGMDILKCDY